MFDEFFGLPLHAFVVHAAVVLLPASAAVALAYVALPAWRWLLRWPLVAASLFAPALTWVTVQAGKSLANQLGIRSPLIETHQQRAATLLLITLAFGLAGLLAAFALGGPSLLVSGAGGRRGVGRPVQIGVGALLAVVAVLVVVWVVLTGDAGSRSVWAQLAATG
jgi:hypothetical protein